MHTQYKQIQKAYREALAILLKAGALLAVAAGQMALGVR